MGTTNETARGARRARVARLHELLTRLATGGDLRERGTTHQGRVVGGRSFAMEDDRVGEAQQPLVDFTEGYTRRRPDRGDPYQHLN